MPTMRWTAPAGGATRTKEVAENRVAEYLGYGWTVEPGQASNPVPVAPRETIPEPVQLKLANPFDKPKVADVKTTPKRGRPKKWS